MENDNNKKTIISEIISGLIFFLSIFALFTATTIMSSDVLGVNNMSTITKVNVSNSEPDLYKVIIAPNPIDLNPGSTYKVNCTGYVYDINGWGDIIKANATLYDTTQGNGGAIDNNHRYQNLSCNCTQFETENFNASCTCTLDVFYYANNGTWRCNMTIMDQHGLKDTLNSSTAVINSVIGINTPSEINYGNLSVTETSEEKIANISNYGNVPINISIRGYGGYDTNNPDNLSMTCNIGNISILYERYSTIRGTSFTDMINLSNITKEIDDFKLPIRTNDTNYGNDTNATYWRIYIPNSVAGSCNGTIEFYATDSS